MQVGIREGKGCYDNNIVGNTVNYFEEEGILVGDTGTRVSDNIIEADRPYHGNPNQEMIQSFQAELTSQFIDSLR
jgi:parallel beta-helix repeat protein